MIFSIADHIEMIKDERKTQTRRRSDYYKVGRTYSIQPGRTQAGIAEGRIRITAKRKEYSPGNIGAQDAWDEGMYMSLEFERLYRRMYHDWVLRYAYTFEYIPIENYRLNRLSK